MDQSLQFDEREHRYTLAPAGVELPSVTTILKDVGIIDYSHIPQEVLLKASRRGTAVHAALHYLDDGDLDESTVSEEIAPYIEAYQRFCRDIGFVPAFVEYRDWHRSLMYAGTLDRIGGIKRKDGGRDRMVLDFKSGLTGPRMPGHALQVTAYAAFMESPRKYRRGSLGLTKEARYELWECGVTPHFGDTFDKDFNAFRCALGCAHWKRQKAA